MNNQQLAIRIFLGGLTFVLWFGLLGFSIRLVDDITNSFLATIMFALFYIVCTISILAYLFG